MHYECTKRPYFHFRSKIWRHHRVPRPGFPKIRENFGDLRTFKADIGLSLIFAWILKASWPKMRDLGGRGGQNSGRDGAMLTFNELVFTFLVSCVCTNFGENRSRNATLRVLADWHTDWRKPPFYNLTHAICYSYGIQIIIIICLLWPIDKTHCTVSKEAYTVSRRLSGKWVDQ